jgi:hypothetical protein
MTGKRRFGGSYTALLMEFYLAVRSTTFGCVYNPSMKIGIEH